MQPTVNVEILDISIPSCSWWGMLYSPQRTKLYSLLTHNNTDSETCKPWEIQEGWLLCQISPKNITLSPSQRHECLGSKQTEEEGISRESKEWRNVAESEQRRKKLWVSCARLLPSFVPNILPNSLENGAKRCLNTTQSFFSYRILLFGLNSTKKCIMTVMLYECIKLMN